MKKMILVTAIMLTLVSGFSPQTSEMPANYAQMSSQTFGPVHG